jgi:excisionase family DNA binding protein
MANTKTRKLTAAEHEKRKARMRAYYRTNKDKFQKYKREQLTRMSESERDARRQKQAEYHRAYYRKHRERIIARTARYQKTHAKKFAAYRAEWHQKNKKKVNARRKLHYHKVVKPRDKAAKAASPFVSVREAVTLLGAKLRPFRELVYRGHIAAERTPGGRYLLRRDDVERIRVNCHHLPKELRERLGLNRKGEAKWRKKRNTSRSKKQQGCWG